MKSTPARSIEIEPETICLQETEARYSDSNVGGGDSVPIEE